MNKTQKILLKISKVLAVCIAIFGLFSLTAEFITRYDTDGGLHTYVLFGDRFEVWVGGQRGETRSLIDTQPIGSKAIVAEIERYYTAGDYVYILGYHSDTGVNSENPRFPSFANLIDGENRIKYYSLEEIPRYIILDYKTADIKLYKTLDEVPENQKIYFTKKLNPWCDLIKTCYEMK